MNLTWSLLAALTLIPADTAPKRALQFQARTREEAILWQKESRQKLFQLLTGQTNMARVALDPEIQRRVEMPAGGYILEEVTLRTFPDRQVRAWVASPSNPSGKVGAVLALHGHGGTGEQIVKGHGLYWYGRALAEMGYVVISPDIGQHELQHTNWTLMGERVWDALRCLDYLETRPEVDPQRLAVAGLSLGGETAMYVAALDGRVQAVCSSGWLTTVANMKQGHCPCWNFPGLEEHFDFSDIFGLVAPRRLVLELGEKERAPGGFPVTSGRSAFEEMGSVYRMLEAESNLNLTIHQAGHVYNGRDFWQPLQATLGVPRPWLETKGDVMSAAIQRGEIARRCFHRALNLYDGWWDRRDLETSLYPRRLDQAVWAPNDNAADMLPFLFITAHYLAPARLNDVMRAFESEKKMTSRLGPLPDWYSLTNRSFVYTNADLPRLIFNAAEYCKDGLIPMVEVMGPGPWQERLRELLDAVFEHAPVSTEFGFIPTADIEVNGDLLQALARFYSITREKKYLDWAERIADAYCFEVLPKNGWLPAHHWDFAEHKPITDTLNLNDHGNELIGGLAELFVITTHFHPVKAQAYKEPLRKMFHRLLEVARTPDNLWVTLLKASTGTVLNGQTPDTWGYALAAADTFGSAAGDEVIRGAVPIGLRAIQQAQYLDWNGADSYADSIEGGLLLLNRYPEAAAIAWLRDILPIFLGKQRDDGIVEGWYGDGNYARTALMAGLYFTQGVVCRPWRPDLRFGAVRGGETLRIAISAESDWEGRIYFDTPRHKLNMKLPVNYARLNEFPEWFTVKAESNYVVDVLQGETSTLSGTELAKGFPSRLQGGTKMEIKVAPAPN